MPPLPSIPIITPSLLHTLRTYPHLPQNTWYFIAGVTLSVLNRPEEIPKVFGSVLENGVGREGTIGRKPGYDEQIRWARRMREALVKSAPIAGLPKTINALLALKTATPPSLLDLPSPRSPSSHTLRPTHTLSTPIPEVLHRGQRFFDRIYGKIAPRVMGQMENCGTEDLGIVARLMYGYVLSDIKVLSAVECSWVLIAGLIPQDVNPQLKGHLKGALNNGATVEQVHAVREVVIRICEAAGMRRPGQRGQAGWGWRDEVAKL
ncbi:MAG: hypothetical protein M1817_005889 [Caeruleum heppii]|nr:MAG: hypothetical protein M1817_005889 [Caeruleum heppii]